MVSGRRALFAAVVLCLTASAVPAGAQAGGSSAADDGPVRVTVIVNRSTEVRVVPPQVEQRIARDRAEARALIADLSDDDEVLAAAVDHRVRILDDGPRTPTAVTANGTFGYPSSQWALTTVRALPAWGTSTGTDQVVAVIDTGTDTSHPDLAGRVLPGAQFTTASNVSTGDGSADDNGHGTHVAGIVAAIADNGFGVSGLAPDARILPVKALGADGTGWSSDINRAVLWATNHGATVINMSLGGDSSDSASLAAVNYAISRGVAVVASAGNDGPNAPPNYPAAYPGVVAVAATTSTGGHPNYSQVGSYIDVAAPGSSIVSTYPVALSPSSSNAYATMSGTSMAAPHVSALAALVASRYDVPSTEAIDRILATAVDRGTPGRDDLFGNGEVDAYAAVCPATLAGTAPGAPAGLAATQDAAGVHLTWTAPSCTGGTRDVTYVTTATPTGSGSPVEVSSSTTTAHFTGLAPSTAYSIVTRAVTSGGASDPSAPVSVTTAAGAVGSGGTTTTTAPLPTTTTSTTSPTTTSTTSTTSTTVPPVTTTTPPSTTTTTTPAPPATTTTTRPPAAVRASSNGYRVVGQDGRVTGFGAAAGGNDAMRLNQPVVGMASTPTGRGYWLVARDGGIFSFGDAAFFGSTGSIKLNQPIVGMASSPTGRGYWFVAADGGIFAFGDAAFFGSTGSIKLNQPIVGMASTPTGRGYWLVARDGGIFSFGDAAFFGSTGSIKLNQPIVGMASSPTGRGYWFVAADGGIFSYGDAGFHGSTGGTRLAQPIVGMAPAGPRGYWLLSGDGRVFSFGEAAPLGSAEPGAVAIAPEV